MNSFFLKKRTTTLPGKTILNFLMLLRKVLEISFNDSLNKHSGAVLENIIHVFTVFNRRNEVN